MEKVKSKINITIKLIFVFLVFFIFYFLCNTKSRFKTLENYEITALSNSSQNTQQYYLSNDKKVYILKDKNMIEIPQLKNVDNIVVGNEFTVCLKGKKIYMYNLEKEVLEPYEIDDNCVQLANGHDFFAMLLENGEVWTSKNIFTSENGPIKIPIDNIKELGIFGQSFSRSYDIHAANIIMEDEKENLWIYGADSIKFFGNYTNEGDILQNKPVNLKNIYNYSKYGLNGHVNFGKGGPSINILGSNGLCYTLFSLPEIFQRDCYVDGYKYDKADKYSTPIVYYPVTNIRNIEMGHDKNVFLTKDNKLYVYYNEIRSAVPYTKKQHCYKNIDSESEIYTTDIGTIVIEPAGNIIWLRDKSILYEKLFEKNQEQMYDEIPLINFL